MKYADKIGAKYSMVLGDDEIASQKAVLKNMKTGEKKTIDLSKDFVEQYVCLSTEQEDLRFNRHRTGTDVFGRGPAGRQRFLPKTDRPRCGERRVPIGIDYLFGGAIWQSL